MGISYLAGFTLNASEKTEEMKITQKIVTFSEIDGLRPPELTSKPGTTVIWVNQSDRSIEILFLDKKVVLACSSPTNFFVGKDGAYESNKIYAGNTASLCFVEKGKYEYKVEASKTFYVGRLKRGNQGVIWIK
jgi:plastocyanin